MVGCCFHVKYEKNIWAYILLKLMDASGLELTAYDFTDFANPAVMDILLLHTIICLLKVHASIRTL